MTKSELRTGMIVEYRGGEKAQVMLNTEHGDLLIGENCPINLTNLKYYNNDLTPKDPYGSYYIVKVYQPSVVHQYTQKYWHEAKLIWERSEFTYPMWFKHKYSPLVVKFTSINEGEVIIEGNNRKFGETKFANHTDTVVWEQIDEPKVCEFTITDLSKELGIHPSLIRIKE